MQFKGSYLLRSVDIIFSSGLTTNLLTALLKEPVKTKRITITRMITIIEYIASNWAWAEWEEEG
jgi:hypothetical protein